MIISKLNASASIISFKERYYQRVNLTSYAKKHRSHAQFLIIFTNKRILNDSGKLANYTQPYTFCLCFNAIYLIRLEVGFNEKDQYVT